jgi:hypothetical protein
MILKPPRLCSLVPIRFVPPSLVNDTPKAWAKLERDYQQFLRELGEAVRCFGAERVKRDVHGIIKGRQGRTANEERNRLLLAGYDARAKGKVKLIEAARGVREKHHLRTVKDDSVTRQWRRLLKIRERQSREKAEFDRRLRKPSVVGSGTK